MNKELHIISTGKQQSEKLVQIAAQIHPYIDAFHIREKHLGPLEVFEIIKNLITNDVPAEKIYVNSRPDAAAAARVGGVQLTYSSPEPFTIKRRFPGIRVGCSVHSIKEAVIKEKNGADFILYGHIFETPSKSGIAPRGSESLRKMADNVEIPIIALGGITIDNTSEVLTANASGIAVMSGVMLAPDPTRAVKEYRNLVNNY